ncbi:unnamed protein product [Acanthoscelides obtectus]|uniref:Ion transport peptide n=1 Tax=Acanthoscelides obtectus TaxID=200917 RepID=A0A9P0JK74_ACAOB|nr:unnamed protein product [Acanthoscelides obtectus]CAK1657892.1 hypothetical protein AOBTE_LOCUS20589 [Acanthoscelides obtectus]
MTTHRRRRLAQSAGIGGGGGSSSTTGPSGGTSSSWTSSPAWSPSTWTGCSSEHRRACAVAAAVALTLALLADGAGGAALAPRRHQHQHQHHVHHHLTKRSFADLRCRGVYDKSIFARLDRICEDCYNLFREPSIHSLCRSECFSTKFFKGCVESLLMVEEMPKLEKMIEYLSK